MDNKREYALKIRLAIRAAYIQARDNPANIHTPTAGQRGAVIGVMNKIAGGDDNRKLLLGWLFGGLDGQFDRMSTKSLNDAQWSALYAWCDFQKDEEQVIWKPQNEFSEQLLACLSAAMDDYFDVKYLERDGLPEPPDIVAAAVKLGGEITDTEVGKKVGIKGVPDKAFEHENELPKVETPKYPYVSAEAGEAIIAKEPEKSSALKPVLQTKPKLYNPFD